LKYAKALYYSIALDLIAYSLVHSRYKTCLPALYDTSQITKTHHEL